MTTLLYPVMLLMARMKSPRFSVLACPHLTYRHTYKILLESQSNKSLNLSRMVICFKLMVATTLLIVMLPRFFTTWMSTLYRWKTAMQCKRNDTSTQTLIAKDLSQMFFTKHLEIRSFIKSSLITFGVPTRGKSHSFVVTLFPSLLTSAWFVVPSIFHSVFIASSK